MHRRFRSTALPAAAALLAALAAPCALRSIAADAAPAAAGRNVIIIVCDGLRAGSVTESSAPTLYKLETGGVRFANSHSLFPTFTTPNASAIATGHYLGDTGDFSNTIYVGYPIFNTGNFGNAPGTVTPFVENNQVLSDIDDHFGGNYLTEETLLAYAREHGYNTAAVGKQGPVLIQDVTQGNIDHSTGTVPPPQTIIIDDSTGKTGGVPLNGTITAALTSAGLALVAPDRSNGAAPTSQQSNGFSGNNSTPGTLAPNTVQQQYFTDSITKAILPTFKSNGKPFAMVYWSRDPDGTQHNQGDSLNTLTPGVNGPTALAAIKNVDNNVAQIEAELDQLGMAGNTDIFVTADHGFNTISKHELSMRRGDVTRSYSTRFTYKNVAGVQEVNTGFLPVGFAAIDLAHFLGLPLFDPDAQVMNSSGKAMYKPVDPATGQANAQANQRPTSGDGLIGGTGAIKSPPDAQAVIAANGGSDLIYVPNGRYGLVQSIVRFLSQQDYVSGIFVDDAYGIMPGALPLSAINLKGNASTPTPTIVVNFRSFATNPSHPNQSSVVIADSTLQEGQGMHGSFSRGDTYNFMAAAGPDFKQGYVDSAPVSNADVQMTLADLLQFDISDQGDLIGRVAREALAGQPDLKPGSVLSGRLISRPTVQGAKTVLKFQQVGHTRYFDAAGFPGRTEGL